MPLSAGKYLCTFDKLTYALASVFICALVIFTSATFIAFESFSIVWASRQIVELVSRRRSLLACVRCFADSIMIFSSSIGVSINLVVADGSNVGILVGLIAIDGW